MPYIPISNQFTCLWKIIFLSNIMFFNTDQQTKVFRILFLNCIRSQVNEFIQNIIFIRKISILLSKVNKFTWYVLNIYVCGKAVCGLLLSHFLICVFIFFLLYTTRLKKIIITSIVRYRNQWPWDIKYSFAYIHTLNIYILEGCIKVIGHIVYILQVTTIINYISYCIFGNLAPSHNNTTISLLVTFPSHLYFHWQLF